MYTVIWQENGVDKWDRLRTKEEVRDLLTQLEAGGNVCIGDVWIFTPEADQRAIEGNRF